MIAYCNYRCTSFDFGFTKKKKRHGSLLYGCMLPTSVCQVINEDCVRVLINIDTELIKLSIYVSHK